MAKATVDQLERQLKDYSIGGLNLFWRRQAMFAGVAVIGMYYYSFWVALVCYTIVSLLEASDYFLSKSIAAWDGSNKAMAKVYLRLLTIYTLSSSISISAFIFLVAKIEHSASHFTPFFFLFAAALFAAMNNHQLLQQLILRIVIYSATLIYIAVTEIWVSGAPLKSGEWLQLFTIVFLLYFIVDCSMVFLRVYRRHLDQIEQLRIEHDLALAALRAKSEFLSVVSHELRTPLTSIKGALDLVGRGALGEVPGQMSKVLDVASRNSGRLAALVEDLLELQALESGSLTLELRVVDLSEIVRESIEAIETDGKARGISIAHAGLESPIYVRADTKRMTRVMGNMLSNAIKFSPQGGIVSVDLACNGGRVRISVSDNGRGIPPGSKDVVFGAFAQIDSTDTRQAGGTGLGMNISKKIVDSHNGLIDYVSVVGSGTTFFVELEIAADDLADRIQPERFRLEDQRDGELAAQ